MFDWRAAEVAACELHSSALMFYSAHAACDLGASFFLLLLCRLDILLYQAVKNANVKGVYSSVKSPFNTLNI